MPSEDNRQGGGNSALPEIPILGPRLYLNGFPKSGLHLLWTWAIPFVAKQAAETPWAGSFQGHSWTTKWTNSKVFFALLDKLAPGMYLKGHAGYRDDIERKLYEMDAVHIFVYRDPRDVAVSQAHHVMDANVKQGDMGRTLYHPGAESIKEMARGEFDYVLAACIAGYGPWAGLIERWELYAPWLKVGWTLCLKFEDMVHRPRDMAQLMIRYVYGRTAKVAGYNLALYKEDLDKAADDLLRLADKNRKNSPTYRRGETGGWRDAFTDDHIELWRKHDPTDWVTRLGYKW